MFRHEFAPDSVLTIERMCRSIRLQLDAPFDRSRDDWIHISIMVEERDYFHVIQDASKQDFGLLNTDVARLEVKRISPSKTYVDIGATTTAVPRRYGATFDFPLESLTAL